MAWLCWTGFAIHVGAELNEELVKISREGRLPVKHQPDSITKLRLLEIWSYKNPGERGTLRCGGSQQAPGFSNQSGHRLGLRNQGGYSYQARLLLCEFVTESAVHNQWYARQQTPQSIWPL